MSLCRVISCVVGRGCLLWPVSSLDKTLLAFAYYTPIKKTKKRIGCLILESTGLGWLQALARGSNDVTGCHHTFSSSHAYSILVPFSGRFFFSMGISRFTDPHPISLATLPGKVSLVLCEPQPHRPINVISQEVLGAGQPDLGHMLWWVGSIPLKLQTVSRKQVVLRKLGCCFLKIVIYFYLFGCSRS